jgi:hypothetical protein
MGFAQVCWLDIRLDFQRTAVLENRILFTSQKPKQTTDFLKQGLALEIFNLLISEIDPANKDSSTGPGDLCLRQRGASWKVGRCRVADVLQVGDADLAGVETVASHFAQKCEESDSGTQRWI